MTDPRMHPLADGGLLATFGDHIDIDLSRRIGRLVDALDALAIPGVVDLVPSYTTLVVIFDPLMTDGERVGEVILACWRQDGSDDLTVKSTREVVIPVQYGDEHGPDLADVMSHTGLASDEIVRRHAAARYVVGALGFSPGFAFLIGLPPELAVPRMTTPRTAVPAGSVGIGGAQTGVYAQSTPGGWSLIGRTPLRLFHPDATDPEDTFLIQGGDTVRFEPIDAARFIELQEQSDANSVAATTSAYHSERDVFEVISPGLQTMVQDLGRVGLGRFGVSPGGAADRGALIAANRAVGNVDDAAGLEITMLGPRLRAVRPCRIALTGADLGARIHEVPVVLNLPLDLGIGDELWFDPARASTGVRAYLAIAGGIDVPIVMGSRATDLTAGFGGLQGRVLAPGDRLPGGEPGLGDAASQQLDKTVRTSGMIPVEGAIVRVVRGPQADRFDDSSWNTLLGEVFTVSSQSNRMGVRLDGPSLMPVGGADVISEGIVTGAIQITGSGQPIVMLPAHATIGGYAKIATVITADLDLLAQAKPGSHINFREVSVAEAVHAAREPEVAPIASIAEQIDARSPVSTDSLKDVRSLIRDFPGFDLESFEIDIPEAGIHLRLARH